MRPIIKRITEKFWHNLCIFQKLFFVRAVARDITFVNAAKTHRAPLVMVARKPQFPYVGKLLVVFNIFFVEMTVIVDNRQIRNAFVNSARGVAAQQKIFIKKSHFPFSFLKLFYHTICA